MVMEKISRGYEIKLTDEISLLIEAYRTYNGMTIYMYLMNKVTGGADILYDEFAKFEDISEWDMKINAESLLREFYEKALVAVDNI